MYFSRLLAVSSAAATLLASSVAYAQVTYSINTPIIPSQVIHTYSGDTTGGPRFQRPLSGRPPTGVSSVGNNVAYHTFSFAAPATTNYNFLSVANFDNFTILYGGAFNPATPLTNALVANDDFGSTRRSGFDNVPLTQGQSYTLVTTSFSNSDAGTFTNTITQQGTNYSIPDNSPGGVAIPLNVSTLGNITSLNSITLFGLSHTWIGDLTISLQKDGKTVALLDRLGRTGSNTVGSLYDLNGDYTFADGATPLPLELSGSTVLAPGIYGLAPNITHGNLGYAGSLSDFEGMELAGIWTLNISDRAALDTGRLQGWGLNVTVVPEPGTYALLLGAGIPMGLLAMRRRRK